MEGLKLVIRRLMFALRPLFAGIVDRDADVIGPTRSSELRGIISLPIRVGVMTALLFFCGFGLWAAFAPLSGAVAAAGQVGFANNAKQFLQAVDGGQIEEVYVKDGDRVVQGQKLIKFEDVEASTSLSIVSNTLFSLELTALRLRCELTERDFIIPYEILQHATDMRELQEFIDNQRQMFEIRVAAKKGKRDLLSQGKVLLEKEYEGLNTQLVQEKKRLEYLDTEMNGLRDLVKSGYAPRNRLLESESRRSEILRSISNYETSIAKNREELMATDIKLLNLKRDEAHATESELLATNDKIVELTEKKRVLQRNLERTMLVAPIDGIVNNMQGTFVGSVIRPGNILMELIPPSDSELTIEAHLNRDHIDAFLGDVENIHDYGVDGNFIDAKVRFPAYSGRWRRPLLAKVIYVAADAEQYRTSDGAMRSMTYVIRVKIIDEELNKFPDIKMYPGMAAEVYVITGSHTLLSYMFDPIVGVLRHSMSG